MEDAKKLVQEGRLHEISDENLHLKFEVLRDYTPESFHSDPEISQQIKVKYEELCNVQERTGAVRKKLYEQFESTEKIRKLFFEGYKKDIAEILQDAQEKKKCRI